MGELKSWMKLITCLWLLLFVSVVLCIHQDEAAYVQKLKKALTAPTPWSNDTNTDDICSWSWLTCDSTNHSVNSISLGGMSLSGTIPYGLNNSLTNLTYLDLSQNNLTGPLPSLAGLTSLQTAYLYSNKFTSVPDCCFSALSSLQSLSLGNNPNLSPWPFPSHLNHSSSLQYLNLRGTNLMGSIPPLNLSQLTSLHLSQNNLSGPLPSLSGLSSLQDVDLSDNKFNSIPHTFFTHLLGVETLNMSDNHNLTPWTFPSHLNFSASLDTLDLSDTNLMGSIPPALFRNCSSLTYLLLSDNSLNGSIPDTFATLPQLKFFDLSNNNFSGHTPNFSHHVTSSYDGNPLLSAPPPPSASPSSHSSLAIIAGASIASIVVSVVIVLVIYNRKRFIELVQKMVFKKTLVDQNVEDFISRHGALALKRYSYSEVKRMTNSFCDKLGQGGYGTVYKANLADGCQLAVKVLSELRGRGEEFINEVATISRTSHVNIVSLVGFCYEINKRALIYEFMANGSLDKFIIYKEGSPNAICILDWNTLYKITIGIARGLEYLHQGCNTRILHLDIKPQNILLDEDFCPKIADFGLAKICKRNQSIVSMLDTRGTPGYIAPEVFSRTYGGVSHKSDVYSYGMLILEVVGGRKNYDSGESYTSEMCFPDWVYKDLKQGNIPGSCLVSTNEEKDMVMKITLISMWCIQPNPLNRPSMSEVVDMLEGPLQTIKFPPKPILYSPDCHLTQLPDSSHSNICDTSSTTTLESSSIK